MAEAIRVAVRVRPFNGRENDLGSKLCIEMQDKTTTVMPCGHNTQKKDFTFDFSYWSHNPADSNFADQDTVMSDIGTQVLQNALLGFHGCLFAYGQTGSGKSYSVMGYKDAPGIIPRLVQEVFNKKDSANENVEIRVWVSFVEIYNEKIRDLFAASDSPEEMKVIDHPKLGVYIPGLTESACASPTDVDKMMDFGTKKRVVAATQMNATSSRSHAVFQVRVQTLEGAKPAAGKEDNRKSLQARVNLVDLAGSERQSKTGASGDTLKEGCAINQSLSALGLVIKDLSETMAKGKVKPEDIAKKVPFRSSKLTFLLKDCLAGNSKTFMIAAISPADDNADETISTLRFASSVKQIKTVARVNKDKKDEMIDNLQEEIKRLKASGGGGEGMPAEMAEQLAERERLVEEMKKSYDHELEAARVMDQARQDALADSGLSHQEMTEAFGVDKNTPYFLNMADDPMLAGCLLYFLKEGEDTTVGSNKESTICLEGIGIPDQLCAIKNEENKVVTVSKSGPTGRVVVNGKLLQEDHPITLRHNDKVFLGRAFALKMTLPADAGATNEAMNLSLEGLEDMANALDDSETWISIAHSVDAAVRSMPADKGKAFMEEVKMAVTMCDEANEITFDCRAADNLHFDCELTGVGGGSGKPSVIVCVSQLHQDDLMDAQKCYFVATHNHAELAEEAISGQRYSLEELVDAEAQFNLHDSASMTTILVTSEFQEIQYCGTRDEKHIEDFKAWVAAQPQEGSQNAEVLSKPLHFLSVSGMNERLQRMRDMYQILKQKAAQAEKREEERRLTRANAGMDPDEADSDDDEQEEEGVTMDVLLDPWKEVYLTDIEARVGELESQLAEARAESERLKFATDVKKRKAMMALAGSNTEAMVRNIFATWKNEASVGKASKRPAGGAGRLSTSRQSVVKMGPGGAKAGAAAKAKAGEIPKAGAKAGAKAAPGARAKASPSKASDTAKAGSKGVAEPASPTPAEMDTPERSPESIAAPEVVVVASPSEISLDVTTPGGEDKASLMEQNDSLKKQLKAAWEMCAALKAQVPEELTGRADQNFQVAPYGHNMMHQQAPIECYSAAPAPTAPPPPPQTLQIPLPGTASLQIETKMSDEAPNDLGELRELRQELQELCGVLRTHVRDQDGAPPPPGVVAAAAAAAAAAASSHFMPVTAQIAGRSSPPPAYRLMPSAGARIAGGNVVPMGASVREPMSPRPPIRLQGPMFPQSVSMTPQQMVIGVPTQVYSVAPPLVQNVNVTLPELSMSSIDHRQVFDAPPVMRYEGAGSRLRARSPGIASPGSSMVVPSGPMTVVDRSSDSSQFIHLGVTPIATPPPSVVMQGLPISVPPVTITTNSGIPLGPPGGLRQVSNFSGLTELATISQSPAPSRSLIPQELPSPGGPQLRESNWVSSGSAYRTQSPRGSGHAPIASSQFFSAGAPSGPPLHLVQQPSLVRTTQVMGPGLQQVVVPFTPHGPNVRDVVRQTSQSPMPKALGQVMVTQPAVLMCSCGSVMAQESDFCNKCGAKRQIQNSSRPWSE